MDLVAGIGIGVIFMRMEYSLARDYRTYTGAGWIVPTVMIVLLNHQVA